MVALAEQVGVVRGGGTVVGLHRRLAVLQGSSREAALAIILAERSAEAGVLQSGARRVVHDESRQGEDGLRQHDGLSHHAHGHGLSDPRLECQVCLMLLLLLLLLRLVRRENVGWICGCCYCSGLVVGAVSAAAFGLDDLEEEPGRLILLVVCRRRRRIAAAHLARSAHVLHLLTQRGQGRQEQRRRRRHCVHRGCVGCGCSCDDDAAVHVHVALQRERHGEC